MVTNPASLASSHFDGSADARRALRASIKGRWSKFNDFELGALADNFDLVNQVAIKYGLELRRAKAEVADFLKDRKI
jgi:hypothetical protein